MDQELFEGLKKGRRWALEAVCQEDLRRTWYLSCQLAGNPASGVPLLLAVWKEVLAEIKGAKTPPADSFQTLLSQKLLELSHKGVDPNPDYEDWKAPQLPPELQPLEKEVATLPQAIRPVFWVNTYGSLPVAQAARITDVPQEQLESQLEKAEEALSRRRSRWTMAQRAAYVRLSTLLRDIGGNGFAQVQLPDALLELLWKEDGLPVKPPKQRTRKPWTRRKVLSVGIAVGVAAVLIAALAVVLALTF
ncbi:MAG: hypothetical protein ACOYJZ_04885 [Acutalibacter sp.]|jgi:hypothetical protein